MLLFAMLAGGNEFYPISFLVRRALAAYFLVGLLALQILRLPTGWYRQPPILGALMVALVSLVVVATSETTSLVLAGLVLATISLLHSMDHFKSPDCNNGSFNPAVCILDSSAVVWLLVRVAYELPLAHSGNLLSAVYRQFELLPANLTSSTAIGLSGFALYSLVSLFTVVSAKRLPLRIFAVAVFLGSIFSFPFIIRKLPEESPIWLSVVSTSYWLGMTYLLALFNIYFSGTKAANCTEQTDVANGDTATKRFRVYGGLAIPNRLFFGLVLGACGVLAVNLVDFDPISPAKPTTIKVLNRGGLDWRRPTFDDPAPGMFGCLPVFCRANGYEFDVIDSDSIEQSDLENTGILVLINCPKIWTPSEQEIIHDYLSNGGSLLVLGDHTDVFGLQSGFNSLLARYGIEFEFDSAYPVIGGFRGCFSVSDQFPFSRMELHHPGIAIGASLKLSRRARPLIVGKYSFSDIGMRENVMGSFLGNYYFDIGEEYADQVLVATCEVGRGRIVVYGDTSTFQGSTSHSYGDHILPLLNWIRTDPVAYVPYPVRAMIVGLCVLFLGVVVFVSKTAWMNPIVVGVFLSTLLLVQFGASLRFGQVVERSGEHAVIAESHFNATGHYSLGVNSIGSLYAAFQRSGFDVVSMEQWSISEFQDARALVFIAPRRPISSSEINDILTYEANGGVTILACGGPDCLPAERLLQVHNVAILNRPMAKVSNHGKIDKKLPTFVEPYPIVQLNATSFIDDNPKELQELVTIGDECCAAFIL
jgi:hypothetical protein